ncbi:MAG: Gfo/Idh/MocA family oxidoreductase [Planctomycetota bacterium]
MLRVGIIGAENSHALAISTILNVKKKMPGARAVAIWGETRKLAKERARDGQIPRIVKNPAEMLGDVDVVMIDHRHGKYHLPAARPFLEARVPLFIDKPFACNAGEARRFLAEARRRRVPVTSFSVVRLYQGTQALAKEIRKQGRLVALSLTGPCDIRSKYGGVFFYGIHQVEVALELMGTDVREVKATRHHGNAIATLAFGSGALASLQFLKDAAYKFQATAACEKAVFSAPIEADNDPYLLGTRTWLTMARTGKMPYTFEELLAPVAVMAAIERSIRTGRAVRVGKIEI